MIGVNRDFRFGVGAIDGLALCLTSAYVLSAQILHVEIIDAPKAQAAAVSRQSDRQSH